MAFFSLKTPQMNNKKRALDASAKLAYAEVTIFTENVELHTKGVAM